MKKIINKLRLYCQIAFLLTFLGFSFFAPSYAESMGGVLVVAESSLVQKTSVLEIRRIYLGLPASSENLINKPVINTSDRETLKSFLKNIMHMTEKGYQRKLIKRIFRQGSGRIIEVESVKDLVSYLENNLNDVSFMDKETANKTKGIKVVQELW